MTTRRGFTMIELMVALVLTMMVGGVTFQLLTNNQRVSRGQNAHASLQDNVRSGGLIVANELREVGYDSIPTATLWGVSALPNTDLLSIAQTKLQYRAMRGWGVTCATPTTTTVKLRKSIYYGTHTPPQVGDSVSMYVEGTNTTSADDAWVHAGVTAVANTTCTDGGAAYGLTIGWPLVPAVSLVAVPKMIEGGPVRLWQNMELSYLSSNGKRWLGMRPLSSVTVEPVVGPLADSTAGTQGLKFVYRDKNDNVTTVLNDVRAIQITLRGITDERVRGSNSTTEGIDTLAVTTRVALRNTLRP